MGIRNCVCLIDWIFRKINNCHLKEKYVWQKFFISCDKWRGLLYIISKYVYVYPMYNVYICLYVCFPGCSDGKGSAWNAGDEGLTPGSGRYPGGREWLSTVVFLPWELHGQKSLVGCSPWGWKEWLTHTYMYDMYVYIRKYSSNPETECKERRDNFYAERTILKQTKERFISCKIPSGINKMSIRAKP